MREIINYDFSEVTPFQVIRYSGGASHIKGAERINEIWLRNCGNFVEINAETRHIKKERTRTESACFTFEGVALQKLREIVGANAPAWISTNNPPPAWYRSSSQKMVPILLAIPGRDTVTRGRYSAPCGEWFEDGGNSPLHPTHWQPMPELPKESE